MPNKFFQRAVAAASALALILLTPTSARAEVVWNPDTGFGFIGKGDIQIAYGWSNKELQLNASQLRFQYQSHQKFEYLCTAEVTAGRTTQLQTKDKQTTININSFLAYDTRKNAQLMVTGFLLKGFGQGDTVGEQPINEGVCFIGQSPGTISGVVPVFESRILEVFTTGPDPKAVLWQA